MRFGIRPECQATVSVTGVLIKVHAVAWRAVAFSSEISSPICESEPEVDGRLIEKSVAKVSSNLRKDS